jgi:co-chaperonin GroES (HSP10)
MIQPCGYRVMLEVKDITEVDPVYRKAMESGLVIPKDHEEIKRQQNAVDKGKIVAIGPQAFQELGGPEKNGVAVGDMAVYAKYAGKYVEDTDGQKYLIVNDEDIVAILKV